MESGWLVNNSLRSSEGAAATGLERSYQISPMLLPPWLALLQGRRSITPHGFGKKCAYACSIVINRVSFCLKQHLKFRRYGTACGAWRFAAPAIKQFDFAQDRACRWHLGCQLSYAKTSVRLRLFAASGQITDLSLLVQVGFSDAKRNRAGGAPVEIEPAAIWTTHPQLQWVVSNFDHPATPLVRRLTAVRTFLLLVVFVLVQK